MSLIKLFFVLALSMLFANGAYCSTVSSADYDVHVNSSGDIYFKARPRVVLITSDIVIPILLAPVGEDKRLNLENGNYVEVAAGGFDPASWSNASFNIVSGDVDNNGYVDFFLQAKAVGQKSYLIMNLSLSSVSVQVVDANTLGFDIASSQSITLRLTRNGLEITREGFTAVTAHVNSAGMLDGSVYDDTHAETTIDFGRLQASTAVGGLAGTLSISQSGSPRYVIPLNVPEGPGGLRPDLGLVYNGSNRNGLLGVGWTLSGMSSITRCSQSLGFGDSKGLAVGLTNEDRLCFNGKRLQKSSGSSYWADDAEYRTHFEEFTLIKAKGSPADRWFEARLKDGRIMEFRPIKAEGAAMGKNLQWVNTSIRDRFGNEIVITYNASNGEVYPDYITYGANRIDLVYTNGRSDKAISYQSGAPIKMNRFLRKLRVFTGQVNARNYDLIYEGYSEGTGQLVLGAIQECGFDDQGRQDCLAATDVNWKSAVSSWPVTPSATIGQDMKNGPMRAATPLDWNGDGIQDLMSADDQGLYVTLGSPAGLGATQQLVTKSGANSIRKAMPVDINADGRSEILYLDVSFRRENTYENADGAYYPSIYTFTWTLLENGVASKTVGSPFVVSNRSTTKFPGDYDIKNVIAFLNGAGGAVVDVNGDGLDELILPYGNGWTVFKNLSQTAISLNPVYKIANLNLIQNAKGTAVFGAGGRSGDGKAFVFIVDGSDNLKTLSLAPDFSVANASSATNLSIKSEKVVYLDANGDSLTDLAYPNSDNKLVLALNTGMGYTSITTSFDTSGLFKEYEYRLNEKDYVVKSADLNGDGYDDLLFPKSVNGSQVLHVLYSKGTTFASAATTLGIPFNPYFAAGSEADLGSSTSVHEALAERGYSMNDFYDTPSDPYQPAKCSGEFNDEIVVLACKKSYYSYMVSNYCYSGSTYEHCWLHESRLTIVANKLNAALSNSDLTQEQIDNIAGSQGASEYQVADINGDGWTDIIQVDAPGGNRWQQHLNEREAPLVVASFTDGLGATRELFYGPISTSDAYEGRHGGVSFPVSHFAGPKYVVTRVLSDNGIGGTRSTDYRYRGAKLHRQGYGFLGFERVTRKDQESNREVLARYHQNYPYFGLIHTSVQQTLAGAPVRISETVNNYDYVSLEDRLHVFLDDSIEQSFEVDGNLVGVVKTDNSYDEYGNLDFRTTTIGGSVNANGTINGRTFEKQEDWVYDNNASAWLIGFVRSLQTDSRRYENSAVVDHKTSRHEFTSRAGTLSIESETRFVNEPLLTLNKTYQYDSYGNLTQVDTSGAGIKARTVQYQDFLHSVYPQTVINPLGQYEYRTYSVRTGLPTEVTDVSGQTTTTEYDAFGREVSVSYPTGAVRVNLFEACNDCNEALVAGVAAYRVTSSLTIMNSAGLTTAGEARSIQYFDRLNREILNQTQLSDGSYSSVRTTYDGAGRKATVSEPFIGNSPSSVTEYRNYDALDRARTVFLPAMVGATTRPSITYARTAANNERYANVTETVVYLDESGTTQTRTLKTKTTSDLLGNVVSKTEAIGTSEQVTTAFKYDALNKMVWSQVGGDSASAVSWTHDDAGRVVSHRDPNYGQMTYQYDAAGNLKISSDAKGQKTRYTYDALDRQTSRTDLYESPEAFVTSWHYDVHPDVPTCLNGHLCKVEQPGFYELYHLDGYGRPETTSSYIQTGTNELSQSVYSQYDTIRLYDAFGRIESLSYPNNFSVLRRYDANGYLSSVVDVASGKLLKKVNEHSVRGQEVAWTLGNGLKTSKVFDAATGLVQSISVGTIQADSYSWQSNGTLFSRTDSITGSGQAETFGYDALGRLTSRTVDGVNLSYEYDLNGNLKEKPGVTGTFEYNGLNAGPHAVTKAGGVSYQYDANGNMVTRGGDTIDYTAFDKPSRIGSAAGDTLFSYGPDRARYRQEKNGEVTYYIGGGVYEETHSNGAVLQKSYVGDFLQHIKTTAGERFEYLHRDHLDSVRAITASNGGLITKLDYKPFGEVVGDTKATSRGFTDHEHLADSGLIHMNGRVYDPETGRFLSPDPILQAPLLSQNYNRYSYVLNNPLSLTDPSGYTSLYEIDPVAAQEIEMLSQEMLSWDQAELNAWKELEIEQAKVQAMIMGGTVLAPFVAGELAVIGGAFRTYGLVGGLVAPETQLTVAALLGEGYILSKTPRVVTNGLGNQNPLYKAAVQQFKSTDLSNAGRALTKHPEVVGQTKETLRQILRTDAALNDAAHSALRDIMRNGVTTTPTLGRYGTITQVQIPSGFGARWASDGSFIGFINP